MSRRGSPDPMTRPWIRFCSSSSRGRDSFRCARPAASPTRWTPPPRAVMRSACSAVAATPTTSRACRTPPPVSSRTTDTASVDAELTTSLAPKARARRRTPSRTSTAMIGEAPAILAAPIALSPTPPTPITATLSPGRTRAPLRTDPAPVSTPQPSRAAWAKGSPRGTAVSWFSWTRARPAKPPRPIPWVTGRPPWLSRGPCVPGSRRMVPGRPHWYTRPSRHAGQSPHHWTRQPTTWSPTVNSRDREPVATTTPATSCPRTTGGGKSARAWVATVRSVWQRPDALTSTRTSRPSGAAMSMSRRVNPAPTASTTAALTLTAGSFLLRPFLRRDPVEDEVEEGAVRSDALAVHDAHEGVVVDRLEVVQYRLAVVDHGGRRLAPELDHPQTGLALAEAGVAVQLAVLPAHDQRLGVVRREEGLAVPAGFPQTAVERMSGVELVAPPRAEDLLDADGRQRGPHGVEFPGRDGGPLGTQDRETCPCLVGVHGLTPSAVKQASEVCINVSAEARGRAPCVPVPWDQRTGWSSAAPGRSNWVRCSSSYRPPAASSSSCVPRSTIRPASTTRIRSAARTVDRRWAITTAVRPSSASASASWTAASEVLSRWAVASSRMTTRWRASSSRAMVMRWRSPPESR